VKVSNQHFQCWFGVLGTTEIIISNIEKGRTLENERLYCARPWIQKLAYIHSGSESNKQFLPGEKMHVGRTDSPVIKPTHFVFLIRDRTECGSKFMELSNQ
jgi:hypothetical protein